MLQKAPGAAFLRTPGFGHEARCQKGELRLIKRPALRWQFHCEKEKAVEKNKAPQPGHGVSVQAIDSPDQASKPKA
jgi:hypothetical protein